MARYLKGSCNNNWDRHQDKDETPVRTIEITPDSDEVLMRRFNRAYALYKRDRTPDLLAYLKTTAAELDRRGITEQAS